MTSLTAATTRMKSSGTKVVQRPVGDTSGICWKIKQKTKEYQINLFLTMNDLTMNDA